MTSLNIEQSTSSTETVNSVIIEKLYALALTSKVQDQNSDFTMTLQGNILAPSAYEDSVLYLRSKFPNLTITVQDNNFYIRFADPEVERVLIANNISSDGVAVSKRDAQNTTSFAVEMFKDNTTIQTFDELDEFGLTKISNSCFYGATNLERVTIPSSVSQIEEQAFRNCTSLTSVSGINQLNNTGWGIFDGCTNLSTVGIHTFYMPTVQTSMFRNCNNLEGEFNFPNATNLDPNNYGCQFNRCYKVTKLTFGHITTFGAGSEWSSSVRGSFSYCTSLKLVDLGDSITTFRERAFTGDSNLKAIVLRGTTPPNFIYINTANYNDHANTNPDKNTWEVWFGNYNTKIYVPDAALNDYRSHEAFTLNPSYVLPLSEFNEQTIMVS